MRLQVRLVKIPNTQQWKKEKQTYPAWNFIFLRLYPAWNLKSYGKINRC